MKLLKVKGIVGIKEDFLTFEKAAKDIMGNVNALGAIREQLIWIK